MRNLIWGRHAVLEVLRVKSDSIKFVLMAHGLEGEILGDISRLAKARGVRVAFEERRRLTQMIHSEEHQGVIAQLAGSLLVNADPVEMVRQAREHRQEPLLLLLDQIQDPHNLGAILRSAAAAGAHGVVTVSDRAAGITPTVVKASAGAVMHIPVCQAPNLVTTMEAHKRENVWMIGADADAKASYADFDWKRPVALILGQEGEGLRRLVRDHCDDLVRIPLAGPVNSLNVSVAAGILLFEVLRCRSKK